MFAALPSAQQFTTLPNPSPWTPTRPSPLSPRRLASPPSYPPEMNTHLSPSSPLFTFPTNTPPTTPRTDSPTAESKPISPYTTSISSSRSLTSPTYAERYSSVISNPLSQVSRRYSTASSPSARAVRRNAFLNRVKQDRENGRFESRGEQLMFMENIAEQKKWVESMRKRAEEIVLRSEEEDELQYGLVDEREMQALDEYLEQEHALEMELFEHVDTTFKASEQDERSHDAGSGSSFSDDEYDDIFMDLASHLPPSQDMDMSLG